MERNLPAIPIFWNFRPTSRGTPEISELNSGNGSSIRFPIRNCRNVWSNGKLLRGSELGPIFWNFRPTSRGSPEISELNSGKWLFHSLPHPELPECLVKWKAPAGVRIGKSGTLKHPLSPNQIQRFRILDR